MTTQSFPSDRIQNLRLPDIGASRPTTAAAFARSFLSAILLVSSPLLAPQAGQAVAATFTVTSTRDAPDAKPGDGVCETSENECTVRAAIAEANASSGSTVNIPANTYELSLGSLAITASMTVIGAGARTTKLSIPPKTKGSVISVSGDSVTVTISQVTIQGANDVTSGGGISVEKSMLTVDQTTFSNNRAGAFGGAIYVHNATVFVKHSTFSGNTAGKVGGAIQVSQADDRYASLFVENSTFSGNSAIWGGAIANGGDVTTNGSVTVTNSTFKGNSALTTDSITGAGNALYNRGRASDVTIANSILANGTVGTTCSGSFMSSGYNLDQGSSCRFQEKDSEGRYTGDQWNADPQLEDLADNGGPTDTMMIKDTSPAFDVIPADRCVHIATDQRGTSRPQRVKCDIGAVERVPIPTKLVVDAPVPSMPMSGSPFSVTVKAEDAKGPANVSAATIVNLYVSKGGFSLPHDTNATLLRGSSSVTFTNLIFSGKGGLTLSAARTSGDALSDGTRPMGVYYPKLRISAPVPASPPAGHAFRVEVSAADGSGAPFNVISDVHVTLARQPGGGAGGTLGGTVTGTIRAGQSSTIISGLTYSAADTAVVLTASGSGADSGDGAAFAVRRNYKVNTGADTSNGNCTATACSLRDAVAAANTSRDGTAITIPAGSYALTQGELTLTSNVTIVGEGRAGTILDGSNNQSKGMFRIASGAIVSLSGVTVRNGRADYVDQGVLARIYGGAFYNDGTLTVTDATFTNNYGRQGGAIYTCGSLTVANSVFTGNSAAHGGAIKADVNDSFGASCGKNTPVSVTDSTFSGNTATLGGGGGIGIADGFSVTIAKSAFTGNSTAAHGGGLSSRSPLVVTGSTFSANSAFASGGLEGTGVFTLVNSTVSGNAVSGSCSALIGGQNTTIVNSTISGAGASGDVALCFGGGLPKPVVSIKNSIVLNGPAGTVCYLDPAVTHTSGGYNLSGDASCRFNAATDRQNIADPKLDPLANNGGPTQTRALQPGSPAIGNGDGRVCGAAPVGGVDQRGEARPATNCDIGAYEAR